MILVNLLLIFNLHIGLGTTVNDRSIISESFISKESKLIKASVKFIFCLYYECLVNIYSYKCKRVTFSCIFPSEYVIFTGDH